VIITTSNFSKSAVEEAGAPGKTRISLINGEELLDLLIRYRVGVQEKRLTVLTIDAEWWTEALGTDLQAAEVVPPVESVTVPMETPLPVVIVETPPVVPATRKTIDFVLFGESYRVSHWRDVLIQVCAVLAQRHPDTFAATAVEVRGRKRQYVASSAEDMYNPAPIPGTALFVETNLSSKDILRRVQDYQILFGHDPATIFQVAEQ
jgi:negative regulator of replication initiation